jgi:ABC-type nitrate/sulfonate/bicarbonate transport system substrate-binding protein
MNRLDRRTFIKAAAAGGLLPVLLDACGSGSGSSPGGAAGGLQDISYQLSWVNGAEFAGSYLADSFGYYRRHGVRVALLPGGPNTTPEPVVVANRAFVSLNTPDSTAAAIAKGAPLKIVGAHFQKSPFGIMSLASKPIRSPQEMIGKRIGIEVANQGTWLAFLKINHIDPKSVHQVTVQFDPSVLPAGEVDGLICLNYQEPSQLAAKGVKTYVFLMADFGYHLLEDTIFTRTDTLSDPAKRKTLVKFLRGEVLGWQKLVADPTLGARLDVNNYSKRLGYTIAEQTLECKAITRLVDTPDTRAHGLFYMAPQAMTQTVATIQAGGTKITEKQLFDTSVLAEVFQGKSHLS